jgi:prepilin-type N-terminal cleavage/methylation domain-containing protein
VAKLSPRRPLSRAGFTLAELMIVVFVALVFAGVTRLVWGFFSDAPPSFLIIFGVWFVIQLVGAIAMNKE